MLKKVILFIGLAAPLIYTAGILSLSCLSKVNFNEVIVYQYFPPSYLFPHLAEFFIKPLAVISGILLLICCPGILFVPLFIKNSSKLNLVKFFSLGFILNISLLLLATSLVKLFGITIERFHFVVIILIESIIGFFITSKINAPFMVSKFSLKKYSALCSVFLFLVLICFIFFFSQSVLRTLPVNFDYSEEAILKSDFSKLGDLQEEFGIAHHLKNRLLPYWLINSLDKFGTYLYRPHLSFFFNFFSITLFGKSYFALNILSLIFTFGTFLFAYKIICINRQTQ
jgi:hypothetical protein